MQDVSLKVTASGSDKVKLSAPSSTKLSPFSPICPSAPIQQVSTIVLFDLRATVCPSTDYWESIYKQTNLLEFCLEK